jgi:hypothetical protein
VLRTEIGVGSADGKFGEPQALSFEIIAFLFIFLCPLPPPPPAPAPQTCIGFTLHSEFLVLLFP